MRINNIDCGLITVDHLIDACAGDTQRLAALSVLVSMASTTLVLTTMGHDTHQPTVQDQLGSWRASIERIHQMVKRLSQH